MKILALSLTLTIIGGATSAAPLRIATGGHFPPYIFDPGTNAARGMDKDLLDEICTRGDFECTWVDLPMNDIFQSLVRGEIDVITGGFGYSLERDQLVDFTCPYRRTRSGHGTFIGTKTGHDLTTARTGVLDQSLFHSAMEQAGRTAVPYPSQDVILDALTSGEIDVAFGSSFLIDLAEGRGGFIELGDHPTFPSGTVLAVSEDNPDLRAELNELLAQISGDGTLGQLQQRWFGQNEGDVIGDCLAPSAFS